MLFKFSCQCKKLYQSVAITPYFIEFLEHYKHKSAFFIASGSDEKELKETFKQRELFDYFEDIYGSPKTKEECLKIILNNKDIKKAVFIGDAASDLKAAKNLKIDFIFMKKFSESPDISVKYKNDILKVIDSLECLLKKI